MHENAHFLKHFVTSVIIFCVKLQIWNCSAVQWLSKCFYSWCFTVCSIPIHAHYFNLSISWISMIHQAVLNVANWRCPTVSNKWANSLIMGVLAHHNDGNDDDNIALLLWNLMCLLHFLRMRCVQKSDVSSQRSRTDHLRDALSPEIIIYFGLTEN